MPLSGIFFAPIRRESETAGNRPVAAPIQEAIKVLNLRLPSVVGARALAPAALLHAPGGAGLATGGMNLEEFLRRLFGQGRPGPRAALPNRPGVPSLPLTLPSPSPSFSSAPPPRIGPGQTPEGVPSVPTPPVAGTTAGETIPIVPMPPPTAPLPPILSPGNPRGMPAGVPLSGRRF
jgi:hypothetical protein